MKTLILKGKGIVENGELERYNSVRIIHKGNASAQTYQLLGITSIGAVERYVIANKDILSLSNSGQFSKKIQLTALHPTFYVKSSEDAVFVVSNIYGTIDTLFSNSPTSYYRFFNIDVDVNYLSEDVEIKKANITTNELYQTSKSIKKFVDSNVTGVIDFENLKGAELKKLSIKEALDGAVNTQSVVNTLADGFLHLYLPSSFGAIELADLIEKASNTEQTKLDSFACTYSRRVTFPTNIFINAIGGNTEMTTTMVDNLLIDAAASLTTGYINLKSKRTSASDGAVSTMQGKGIKVSVAKVE